MKILDKDYTVKYNLRSMFVWEEITGRPFNVETLMDTYVLVYACIISVKDNPSLDFNDFIDWCDEHPDIMTEFNDYMKQEIEKRNLTAPDNKKKVTRKARNSQ